MKFGARRNVCREIWTSTIARGIYELCTSYWFINIIEYLHKFDLRGSDAVYPKNNRIPIFDKDREKKIWAHDPILTTAECVFEQMVLHNLLLGIC